MSTKGKGLSEEAQQWDGRIQDVHRAEQGDATPGSTPHEPKYDVNDEYAVMAHGYRIDQAIKRLFATAGGKIVVAAIILLFILLALAYVPNWGSDDENTPSTAGDEAVPELDQNGVIPADAPDGENGLGAANAADALVAEGELLPPTHAELAAQEPVR